MLVFKVVLFAICVLALSAALLVGGDLLLRQSEPLADGLSRWFSILGVRGAEPSRFIPSFETGVVLAAISLGVVAPLCLVFKVPILKVFNPSGSFRWPLALLAFLAMFAVQSVALIAMIGFDETYGLVAGNLAGSLIFLILATLVYILSAPLEELIFRRWILFAQPRTFLRCALLSVASAAIFSIAHLSDDWTRLAAHFVSGLAYGWSVARLRGLEFSMGTHVAKNVSLACIVGFPGEREWGDEFSGAAAITMAAAIVMALVAEFIYWRDPILRNLTPHAPKPAEAPTSTV